MSTAGGYGAPNGLTGGGDGFLDKIDGTNLVLGSMAFASDGTNSYTYILKEDGAEENSPFVISPDTNAGNKRWHLLPATGLDDKLDVASNLSDLADAATARTNLGLGTAATRTVGVAADNVLALDAEGKMPAVDGSALTGLAVVDATARADIILLLWNMAIEQIINGFVDDFSDATGINGGSSSNYALAGGVLDNLIYSMVSAAAGTIIHQNSSFEYNNAFDGSTNVFLSCPRSQEDDSTVLGIGKQWASARCIRKAVVKPSSDDGFLVSEYFTACTLTISLYGGTGSFSGGVLLDSESHILASDAEDNAIGNVTLYSDSDTAYDYHWITVTTTTGNVKCLSEIEFYEASTEDMTLVSASVAAASQPDSLVAQLFEEDVDSVTLDTDLKVWGTRDGGTTWTQGALEDKGDYSSNRRILTAAIDLSGQPAGTTMATKITTHNAKRINLYGNAAMWE